MGDAVLAVFGVPRAHEDDAERAVRAALEMHAVLSELNRGFAVEGKPTLEMRIGIEAGEVLVDVERASGPRDRMLTGDAVNTAARLEGAAGSGETPATPFSKGPYIQFPAPGRVTIMWESTTNIPGSVRLGPGLTPDQQLRPVIPMEKRSQTSVTGTNSTATSQKQVTFYLYKASFSDLSPGSVYSYSVELQGFQSPPRHFRTLDPRVEKTRFIVYGDSRSDPKMHTALTAQFAQYEPDFILHTGDLVARGTDYRLWSREFFTPAASFLDHVPFFSVIGNHEQDGTNYLNYFDLPGNKLWYSFDAGPVHVLALDFRFEKAGQAQFKFARKDLFASRAPWKLVVLHTPVYNIGGHASDWGHAAYLPLFHEAKVDMVLAGHSHMYERFRPLVEEMYDDSEERLLAAEVGDALRA
jgi:predicted phosphodiesterase